MRENLAQWDFVWAAYALTVLGTLLLIAWAWRAMRVAEARRDAARGKGRKP